MRRIVFIPAIACLLILGWISPSRAADVENGRMVFEKCAACHSLTAGKNEDAPSLAGIFGRKIASVEEYRYSAAMRRSDIIWTDMTLDAFIEDPQAFIPGNRMPFDGVKNKSEREDLLAYLNVAAKVAAMLARHSLAFNATGPLKGYSRPDPGSTPPLVKCRMIVVRRTMHLAGSPGEFHAARQPSDIQQQFS